MLGPIRIRILLVGHELDGILPGEEAILTKLFRDEGKIGKDGEIWYLKVQPDTQEDLAFFCEKLDPAAVFLHSNIKKRLPWLETVDGIRHLFISATDIYEVFIFGAENAPVLREIKMNYAIERLVPAGD